MTMVGFWVSAQQYRLKHPISGRTQDIYFEGAPSDEWEKIIRARTPIAEKELAEARQPNEPHVARRYSIRRTAFANDVFNDTILTGKVEPCPDIANSRYFFSK